MFVPDAVVHAGLPHAVPDHENLEGCSPLQVLLQQHLRHPGQLNLRSAIGLRQLVGDPAGPWFNCLIELASTGNQTSNLGMRTQHTVRRVSFSSHSH